MEGETIVIMTDEDARLFVAFRKYQSIWVELFQYPLINTKVTLNFNSQGELKSAMIPKIVKS
jgi:hypothetical protein